MALITTGKPLIRDLEKFGALGVYAPLEGGFEGRYQRRLRAAGYVTLHITARGLGDLACLFDSEFMGSDLLTWVKKLPLMGQQ
jgi:hypothetical protein